MTQETSAPSSEQMTPENQATEVSETVEATESTQSEESEASTEQLSSEQLEAEIRAKVEKDLRQQFSKLGRREQALKKQQSDFEKMQAEIDSLKQQAERYSSLQSLRESGNRAQLLKELEVNIDDLTADLVSGNFEKSDPKADELAELKQELLALKQEREAEKQQKQQKAVAEQTTQVKDYIKSLVDESNATLVSAKGDFAIEEIYQAAQEVYQQTGNVDLAEVVQEFEDYYKSEAEKLFETEYAKKIFDERYEKYLAEKSQEKSNTLSTKIAPAAAPEVKGKHFEGKGTAKGLKYLLERRKNS